MLPINYAKLIAVCAKPGCPFCNLLQQETKQMLESLLYEYITDPEINRRFRASRGLCHVHSWQAAQLHKSLGIAILYEAALDEVLKIINHTPDHKLLALQAPSKRLVEALEPTEACMLCQLQDEQETRLSEVLGEYIADEKMRVAYQGSDGLCLSHFKRALRHTPNRTAARLLVSIQRDIWHKLIAELREFLRKNNIRGTREAFGAEGDSWQRVLARLAGENNK